MEKPLIETPFHQLASLGWDNSSGGRKSGARCEKPKTKKKSRKNEKIRKKAKEREKQERHKRREISTGDVRSS